MNITINARVTTLANLNQMTKPEFISLLGPVYEHSPWIAEKTSKQTPFANLQDLIFTMRAIVEVAPDEAKLALLRAHPDLGGKLARTGQLTAESSLEQAGLGLDGLDGKESQQFENLNRAYTKKFGFPFIICAKRHSRSQVLSAFQTRLQNSPEKEAEEALRQVHLIGQLRLEEKVASEIL